jgi:selenide,water dikinase
MQKIGPLVVRRPEVIMGVDSPDDCAIVSLPPPPPTAATSNNNYTPYFDNVHTVDFFRSFYEDPYVFGQIAAQHALSDCHAMGAPAISALAVVVLPFGLEDKVGECLHQMMAGACQALGDSNCALVGGHTCEGPEMALGFCVNGAVPTAAAVAAAAAAASSSSGSGGGGGGGNAGLTKGGMRAGDALVLTQVVLLLLEEGCRLDCFLFSGACYNQPLVRRQVSRFIFRL